MKKKKSLIHFVRKLYKKIDDEDEDEFYEDLSDDSDVYAPVKRSKSLYQINLHY